METNKDIVIKEILNSLPELYSNVQIEFVDYGDEDDLAFGLKKGNRLLYFSGSNIFMEKSDNFYYDIEDVTDPAVYNVIESGEVDKEELITLIRNHFLK